MARTKAPILSLESQALPESGPLRLLYVPVELAREKRWDRNYKVHDLPTVKQSIRTYGFRDPALFDDALHDGDGGIVAGNGRTEALFQMNAGNEDTPDYIIESGGKWYFPLIFGAASPTVEKAEAFALDHNNAGIGVIPADEARKIWEPEGYLSVLKDLADKGQAPVTVRPEQISKWLEQATPKEEIEKADPEKVDKVLKASRPAIARIALPAQAIPSLEAAIAATGKLHDRAAAMEEILQHYLAVHG